MNYKTFQSLKRRDLWELHFASQEFKKHKIPDKMDLLEKAKNAIYSECTLSNILI